MNRCAHRCANGRVDFDLNAMPEPFPCTMLVQTNLSPLHQINRVLAFFAEHPEATLLELCNAIGITKSMADRDVRALKQDGRLKREGSSFAGHWRVLD